MVKVMSRSNSKSKLSANSRAKSKTGSRGNAVVEPSEVVEQAIPQLAWQILSEEVTKDLKKEIEVEVIAKKLAEILSLEKHEESLYEAAQLDYYVAGYWFASREYNFTDEQTSAFFTMLHTLLHNLKSKKLSLSDNTKEIKEMMVGVDVPDGKSSLECFNTEVAVIALRYIHLSLFQHYNLFQYLFNEEQEEEEMTTKVLVDVPPDSSTVFPPPLEEGVTLELYQRCIAPQPEDTKDNLPEDQLHDIAHVDPTCTDGLEVIDSLNAESDLLKVSAEDLRAMMDSVTQDTLKSYKSEVAQKLKKKEEDLIGRLSKLEKDFSPHT